MKLSNFEIIKFWNHQIFLWTKHTKLYNPLSTTLLIFSGSSSAVVNVSWYLLMIQYWWLQCWYKWLRCSCWWGWGWWRMAVGIDSSGDNGWSSELAAEGDKDISGRGGVFIVLSGRNDYILLHFVNQAYSKTSVKCSLYLTLSIWSITMLIAESCVLWAISDQLMYWQTDWQSDRPTDKVAFRVA